MNENENPRVNEFTAADEEIRFDPENEQEQKTAEAVAGVAKPKKAKWYFILPLVFLLLLAFMFIGWLLKPKTPLNVCLLDKTVLTVQDGNDIDIRSAYRKHQGFFWLLEQQKYVFQNKKLYDYKTDYFGPMLDETGKIKTVRNLSELDYTPDLMYIADVYGAVDDTYGYYGNSNAKDGGITVDDMSVISYAYENGATVVAEMELFNSNLDSSVYSQLSSLCGIKPTGWVGRYIYDLQDFTDVPDWAPPMYEKQEGVEWQFSGPGILLVSSDKIIVLEQKTDFDSKNLLKIRINEDYKKQFRSCGKVNFYNWFEIVEPNSGTDVIASFELDVNATGMEKLKGVLKSPVFSAAMCKKTEGKAPVYYFAGDFNDYVSHENYNRFLFADRAYRLISYDRQGDISNFYWNFYNPLMKKILSDIEPRAAKAATESGKTARSRVTDNGFERLLDDKRNNIKLNAVAINGSEPGEKGYSRNYTFYEELVNEAVKLGANCLYAKDILPPEFYRAIYANNSKSGGNTLYLIQNIAVNGADSEDDIKSRLESAADVLHGKGKLKTDGSDEESSYFIDISDYLLAVTVNAENGKDGISYSGKYASGSGKTGMAALLYDTVQRRFAEEYGYTVPIGIYSDSALIKDTGAYSLDGIVTDKTCRENYAFFAVSYGDARAEEFEALNAASGKRLLISGLGSSSANGQADRAAVTEKEQGRQTADLLSAADKAGVLAAVAADLNDDWSAVSEELYPFTVPLENNRMWQNTADPAQTTGLVALDAEAPRETGINLADDDRIQMLSLSSGAGYFYITAQLLTEIDYTAEQLFIGLDTYQRNDGEYYYSKEYTPTALSGMEFVLRFTGKQEAELDVIASYDRSRGAYVSRESYSGDYNTVSRLKYGGFTSGDNQFYQTGSTIYIRIPWSWLNVTDPSQRIVINNEGALNGQAKTVSTNGAVVSVLIADKQTGDQLYLFPEKKEDPAYKTFKWATWETVSYTMREKESFTQIQKYFASK